MTRTRTRIATMLAATAVAAGVSLGSGAGVANAAPNLTYTTSRYQDGKSIVIYLYADGDYAGYVNWNADPTTGGSPGDALRAYDGGADGWGVEGTVLYTETRTASTRGHSSPYTTPWQTGNLTEWTRLPIDACLVKGTASVCIGFEDVVWA